MSKQQVDVMTEIPLDKIIWTGPTDITEKQIQNMGASLLTNELVEPIVVCPADKKGMHRGVVGRLRYEGMKYRWRNEPQDKTILARIHEYPGEAEIITAQLVENLHRREVPAMQKALLYRQLYDLLHAKHGEKATLQTLATQIEEATGNKESVKTIQHYLSLTTLTPEAQQVLTSEKLPLRAGLELLRVEDPKRQVKAAKDIKNLPKNDRTVQDIKWRVETYITDQQRDKQRARLKKKAEELRKAGKIVVIESPYSDMSYKDREKFHVFYGDVPAKCRECLKLGVQLSGNFQQKAMCTDPKCYEETTHREVRAETRKQQAAEKQLNDERAKVYSMEIDIRHWHLMVVGLMDHWELRKILHVTDRGSVNYFEADKALWVAVTQLGVKQCQQLLLQHAVEEVLTEPQDYQGDSPAKAWAVTEFNLTPSLFLKEKPKPKKELKKEDSQQENPPCTQCAKDGVSCGREHFYRNDEGKLVCDQTVKKEVKG